MDLNPNCALSFSSFTCVLFLGFFPLLRDLFDQFLKWSFSYSVAVAALNPSASLCSNISER